MARDVYNPAPSNVWSQQMRGMTRVAALVSLGMAVTVDAAVAFGPATVAPAAHVLTLGKLKLATLHDAQIEVPNGSKTFGIGAATADVPALLRKEGAPTDRITLSVN